MTRGAEVRSHAAPAARRGHVVRQAVLRFTVWSAVTMLLLGVGVVVLGARFAEQGALDQARREATLIAQGLAAPRVNERLRAGDRVALARLRSALQDRLRDGTISHVKVWAADGTILWADQADLVGRRFVLGAEERRLLGTDAADAEVSQLEKAENAGERTEGELLEIYVGATDADGEPILFEAYLSAVPMRQDQREVIGALLPLAIGGLLVFQLAILPLAVSLARRVERAQADRAQLLQHALRASDLERRRIAQDLHDGVIQDLAGVGYAMPAVAAQLPSGPGAADARRAVQRVSEILHRDVAALRSLITDIYPPDLEGAGLLRALDDLSAQAERSGVTVALAVDPLGLSPDSGRLVYRVVREALRNVVRHAGAAHAWVRLEQMEDQVRVRVSDDGVGLGATSPRGTPATGHLGLRLLEDTLRDLGGTLALGPREASAADRGTELVAVLPARL